MTACIQSIMQVAKCQKLVNRQETGNYDGRTESIRQYHRLAWLADSAQPTPEMSIIHNVN